MTLFLSFVWCVASFLALNFMRNRFTELLFRLSKYLSGSATSGKLFYSIIFFPGVVIHELSHFFVANALDVPTGEIQLIPQELTQGYKLGSVKVAKSDVGRTAIIGLAPLLIGSLVLFLLIKVRFPYFFTLNLDRALSQAISTPKDWLDLGVVYIMFAVSNTMMISKSDRQGLLPAAILLGSLSLAIHLIGGFVLDEQALQAFLLNALSTIALTFTIATGINLIAVIPLAVTTRLMRGKRWI